MLIYVDNILLIDDKIATLTQFMEFLNNKVVLQDLGTLHYFLGMRVAHNIQECNIHLSRGNYI